MKTTFHYKTMKLNSFLPLTIPNYQQYIDSEILEQILLKCYRNFSFSTLPYFMYGYNSKESIVYTNTGNCIALAYGIKKYLQSKNITSYLIPCTVPQKYKRVHYLDISHVALAIPKNKYEIMIVDPAFYFKTPIILFLNKPKNKSSQMIISSNIYNHTHENILTKLNKTKEKIVYNQYQTIHKNTFFCECCYDTDINDIWFYYLTEIKNPDQAITNYYLQIAKPFISTTMIDPNGLCRMGVYIKFHCDDYVEISINNQPYFTGNPELFTFEQLQYLKLKMGKFYDSNLRYFFSRKKQMFNEFDFIN